MHATRVAVVAGVVWLGAVFPGAAQQTDGVVPGLRARRPALDSLAQHFDAIAGAADSSAGTRAAARLQAAAVRARLASGDFHNGDRVVIVVEGADAPGAIEQQLSDTFVVGPEQEVTLPAIGVVSLRGVLRSELPDYMTRQIGRIIRDPVVHVRSLIRISVVGAVPRPGFYAVPVDALLSDALMTAGGLGPLAKVDELRIDRLGKPLWRGPLLQRAIGEGRTLDALDLRGGDQFVVPGGKGGDTYATVRTVSLLLGIPITILTLTKVF
jgi:protein involved in polysaccharide export with SLBB domain